MLVVQQLETKSDLQGFFVLDLSGYEPIRSSDKHIHSGLINLPDDHRKNIKKKKLKKKALQQVYICFNPATSDLHISLKDC